MSGETQTWAPVPGGSRIVMQDGRTGGQNMIVAAGQHPLHHKAMLDPLRTAARTLVVQDLGRPQAQVGARGTIVDILNIVTTVKGRKPHIVKVWETLPRLLEIRGNYGISVISLSLVHAPVGTTATVGTIGNRVFVSVRV